MDNEQLIQIEQLNRGDGRLQQIINGAKSLDFLIQNAMVALEKPDAGAEVNDPQQRAKTLEASLMPVVEKKIATFEDQRLELINTSNETITTVNHDVNALIKNHGEWLKTQLRSSDGSGQLDAVIASNQQLGKALESGELSAITSTCATLVAQMKGLYDAHISHLPSAVDAGDPGNSAKVAQANRVLDACDSILVKVTRLPVSSEDLAKLASSLDTLSGQLQQQKNALQSQINLAKMGGQHVSAPTVSEPPVDR